MAAILPAQVMIGIDIRNASSYLRATLLNADVITVQQDPAAIPGRQWLAVGKEATNSEATSPSLVVCNASDDSQQFVLNATGYPGGTIKSLVPGQITPGGGDNGGGCLFVFGALAQPGGSVVMWPCAKYTAPPNTKWQFDPSTGYMRSLAPPSALSQCLTAPPLTLEPCGRKTGQQWRYDATSRALQLVNGSDTASTNTQCLTAKHGHGTPSTTHDYRVWGRALADGSVAVVAVNHGQVPVTIVCDGECFALSNFSATEELLVRDLWTHQELGSITGTLIFENVSADSSSVVLTLRRKTDNGVDTRTKPPLNRTDLNDDGRAAGALLKTDDAPAVRIVTGDGTLALELGATTGTITALELSGKGVAPPLPQHMGTGGLALSEYLGSPFCTSSAPPATLKNKSLIENGNFTQAAGSSSALALGWMASNVPGFTCTGYRRVTGANVTRPGHTAAIQASTITAKELAGASHSVTFAPAMTSMFQTLVLSGWSKAEADVTGASKQALDYSVYADVEYSDGTFSFGEAAIFSTGAHDWEYASHAFRVAKPLKTIQVYAMYRNRIGKVWFSDLALTGVPHTACMPHANGTAQLTGSPTSNWSAASLSSKVAPPSWNGTAATMTATFEGLEDHIRITGAIALTHPRPCPYPNPCPPGDAPLDRAVSLQLAFPLAGEGWKLWSDAETFAVLSAGNSSHTGAIFGGQSERVATLPNTVDRYPMLVLTSPDSTQGIMLAVPMTPKVFVYRIQYDSHRQMLQISFDFGLTGRAQQFPSMATFECLLVPIAQPKWGFRAGLHSYFSLFPEAFRPKNLIRNQGIWLASPEVDVASIPDWQDFGLRFAEEMNEWNVSQSKFMNKNGIMIFPYVEPSNMHWCLAGVVNATWESVHGGISNCSTDPTCGNQANALAIVNDAVVGADGKWIWSQCCAACGANAAIFMYSGLNPETLNDPNSWTSYILARLNAAYDKSVEEGYQIGGMYMDGMVAFSSEFTHINYRESALVAAMHPPIFDSSGRIAVLSTQDLLTFMDVLAKTLHSRGQHLMGNGQYCQGAPNFMFPSVFDVAGTESDWQSGGTPGTEHGFSPPPAVDLLFARAMSGAKPYLHLLDTHLATWTQEFTNQYFQICLVYGIWPSFEEDNTSEAPGYFSNPRLYERDRPVFKQFIPVLQKINYAGWQPLTLANASDAGATANTKVRFSIERFGSAVDGVVYWTLRRVEPLQAVVANPRPVRLTLHTAGLGLAPRAEGYAVAEIAQSQPVTIAPVVVSTATMADVHLSDLPHNTTFVLQLKTE